MTDFIELARAAEEDAAVLGVYADWLEENGQEEASLSLRDTTGESGYSDSSLPGTANNFGYGYGYGNGNGNGAGHGNITGDGSGDGYGDYYYYHGEGYGYGVGYGFSDGSGDGVGAGHIPY